MPGQEATQSKRWVNIRRTERVLLRVPVLVHLHAENDGSSSEESYTLVVNAHGALSSLAVTVQLGQKLVLENRVSREQEECSVVYVGDKQAGKAEVGIAFAHPAPHFWHVDFPPGDRKPLLD
jgi:hypothetical protein